MSLVNEDRISSLDDSTLLHVLSFLPTEDDIRTNVSYQNNGLNSGILSHSSIVFDIWTRFATGAKVEELFAFYEDYYGLRYNMNCRLLNNYTIRRHVFSYSSLTKLNLSHCDIVPQGVITWTMLEHLSIRYTKLSSCMILRLLRLSILMSAR